MTTESKFCDAMPPCRERATKAKWYRMSLAISMASFGTCRVQTSKEAPLLYFPALQSQILKSGSGKSHNQTTAVCQLTKFYWRSRMSRWRIRQRWLLISCGWSIIFTRGPSGSGKILKDSNLFARCLRRKQPAQIANVLHLWSSMRQQKALSLLKELKLLKLRLT